MIHSERLSPKQEQAIQALLSHSTIRAAARQAKTSEATLHRWLVEPAFSEAYRQARLKTFDDAMIDLQQASVEAVKTLRRNLQAESEAIQNRAAVALIELAFKSRELIDFEARFRLIEEQLKELSAMPAGGYKGGL